MLVILSSNCKTLTGSLSNGLGYHLEQRKRGIFSKRNQRGYVPPDGHWRFILACAQLASTKLTVADIKLSCTELQAALEEAHHFVAAQMVHDNYYGKAKSTYNARDILNLKTTFGL